MQVWSGPRESGPISSCLPSASYSAVSAKIHLYLRNRTPTEYSPTPFQDTTTSHSNAAEMSDLLTLA